MLDKYKSLMRKDTVDMKTPILAISMKATGQEAYLMEKENNLTRTATPMKEK